MICIGPASSRRNVLVFIQSGELVDAFLLAGIEHCVLIPASLTLSTTSFRETEKLRRTTVRDHDIFEYLKSIIVHP